MRRAAIRVNGFLRTPTVCLLLVVLLTGCQSGPVFQPDPFHWALIRHYAHATRVYAEIFPVDTVCIAPTEPLCYCPSRAHRYALAGVPRALRLDLSTASPGEINELPGIGPVLAREIVVFRKEEGLEQVSDLLEVTGIGPGRFERIRSLVRVE